MTKNKVDGWWRWKEDGGRIKDGSHYSDYAEKKERKKTWQERKENWGKMKLGRELNKSID